MLDQFINTFGGLTEEYLFYKGEVTLHYDPKAHVYLLLKDGELIPQDGVTTVVHIIDKSDALIPWGCKMMSQKLLNTVPVSTLPTGDKVVPQQSLADFEKLVLDAKGAHKEKLEEASTVGSAAHNWIEAYVKAVLAENHGRKEELLAKLPEEPRACNCCTAALQWMADHKVRWISTERKIYSRQYGYAGTMDGLALVSSCTNPLCPVCPYVAPFTDKLSIIDWKTSNYLYLEYLYQTAAYEQAYEEETADTVEHRWVIRLGKEDGEFDPWHCTEDDYANDFAGFKLCLDLRRNVRATKDRIQERTDLLKAAKKARDRAEREAALKIKCSKADKYKGKGPKRPKCNDGEPCDTCLAKWMENHPEGEAVERNEAVSQEDSGAAAELLVVNPGIGDAAPLSQ